MLLFFDFGTGEILLILLVLFIVVGPRQLPEVARTLGKAINEMKRASAGFRNEIQKEAARLERETGLNEIRKPLNDLGMAEVAQPAPDVVQCNQEDTLLDESEPIPFGTQEQPNTDQNTDHSNKS
jgi:Tat protein translocase TatB subunit